MLSQSVDAASRDLHFAVGVASLAERLRGSAFALEWSMDRIVELSCESTGQREERAEHCEVVRAAATLIQNQS